METLTDPRPGITTAVLDHRRIELADLTRAGTSADSLSRVLPGAGAGRVKVADFQSSI